MKSRKLWASLVVGLEIIFVVSSLALGQEKKQPPEDWPKTIEFGFAPQMTGGDRAQYYHKLGDYLSKTLGIEIKTIEVPSYHDMMKDMLNSELEGGFFGPYSYVEAAEFVKIDPLAMELGVEGDRNYYSILIARADSGITDEQSARGKSLAFPETDSTSGFLVPMLHFIQDLKTTPGQYASRVEFAGSHGLVVKGVYEKKYDWGATNNRDFMRAVTEYGYKPEEFVTLWKSRPIPGEPICVRQDLPESLKKALLDAVVNLKDKEILEGLRIGGYAPATDKDYDLIRELKRKLD